jgi:hypothetical protein
MDEHQLEHFNLLLLPSHRVGQGPHAPADVVRAALLRLINGFAGGTTGVRPELAVRLVDALNSGATPGVRMLGSVGQADLAAMADLAHGVIGDFQLRGTETLSMVNTNAFSTAIATLADCQRLMDSLDVAGALDNGGFAANLSVLHPAVARVRPYAGLVRSLERLRDLLAGSYLWDDGAARNLQDPLTFRNLAHVHGAARDALDHALPLAAARCRTGPGPDRACAGPDRRVRAQPEASREPVLGPPAGRLSRSRVARGRVVGVRRRLGGAGGRGAPARPAGLDRACNHEYRRGDRRPDDDGAARRAPPRRDGRARSGAPPGSCTAGSAARSPSPVPARSPRRISSPSSR